MEGDGRMQENNFKSEDGHERRHELVSNLVVLTNLIEQRYLKEIVRRSVSLIVRWSWLVERVTLLHPNRNLPRHLESG